MDEQKPQMTSAVRQLTEYNVRFTSHYYRYEDKGGSSVSARELGVDEHVVIKTLIMETDSKKPLIVLMHGDCQVSTKQLAREIGVKSITPCAPEVANKHSGYVVGGTSPFGTKKIMPVFVQKTILDLERVFVNGGGKGFLVNIPSEEILKILNATVVEMRA